MVLNVYDITKLRAAVLGEPWTSTLADTVTWDSQLWTLVVSTTRDCVLMRCRMSKSESKLTIPRDVFNMFRFSFHFLTRTFLYQLRRVIEMQAIEICILFVFNVLCA